MSVPIWLLSKLQRSKAGVYRPAGGLLLTGAGYCPVRQAAGWSHCYLSYLPLHPNQFRQTGAAGGGVSTRGHQHRQHGQWSDMSLIFQLSCLYTSASKCVYPAGSFIANKSLLLWSVEANLLKLLQGSKSQYFARQLSVSSYGAPGGPTD